MARCGAAWCRPPGFAHRVLYFNLPPRECRRLFVQDHTQEGAVDLKSAMKSAIVTNEAKPPEFIHEKIDP